LLPLFISFLVCPTPTEKKMRVYEGYVLLDLL